MIKVVSIYGFINVSFASCRNAADMPTNVVHITTVVDYRAQLGYQNNRERVVAH